MRVVIRWARGQGTGILAALEVPDGDPSRLPVATTLTRGLARLDADALDAAVGSFVQAHTAKGATYSCGTSQRWVNEDGGETYTFKLKIDKRVPGAKGSVAMSTGARPFDTNKANDKADVTLDVPKGSSTGGSGGTSGTPGGSTTATAGSTSGSSTTGGSGASSTGGTGSTTPGGLASTGSSDAMLPIAGTAGAAIAAGAGTLVVMRRRRAQGRG